MAIRTNGLLTTVSALALGFGLNTVAQAADPVEAVAPQAPMAQERTISGTVGLYAAFGRYDQTEDSSIDDNPFSIGGDARVDIPLSDMFSLQLDMYGEAVLDGDLSTSEEYTGGFLTGAHVSYRNYDRYLFGAFGGVGAMHMAESSGADYVQWLLGVEGQYYLGNTTLYGQIGYFDVLNDDTSAAIANAFFLRGVIRSYFNGGNTKIEGEASWASGENDWNTTTPDDVDMFGWGAEIEHVVRSFSNDGFVSAFARYEGQYYNEDFNPGPGSQDATVHTFKVGIRMDLNQVNPFGRDRMGATLDMPNLSRWTGNSALVD